MWGTRGEKRTLFFITELASSGVLAMSGAVLNVGGRMQQATQPPKAESNRNFWIYTGYTAAALGLLGILAYHFSSYLLK